MSGSTKIMLALMLLLIIPQALSLGVSPAKRVFDFEPGQTDSVTVTVHNNDKKSFNAVIEVQGALKDHIQLSTNKLEFSPTDESKTFTYKVIHPDTMDRPGLHSADIRVKEMTVNDDAMIRPGLMLTTKAYLKVPYPDKFAGAELSVKDVKLGDMQSIYIRFSNLGSEDIQNAQASIDLINPKGEVVATLNSDSISLPSRKTGELIASFDTTEYQPGTYKLTAFVLYDGNKIDLDGKFEIKSFLIKLLSIAVGEFELGDIANFEATVRNIGNRLVEDFYINMFLQDSAGRTMADVRSFKLNLESDDVKQTNIYWDTTGVLAGEYTGTLSLNYEDEHYIRNIVTEVTQDDIQIELMDEVTGMAINEAPTGPDIPMKTYLGLIIVLLLVIIGIMVWKLRK